MAIRYSVNAIPYIISHIKCNSFFRQTVSPVDHQIFSLIIEITLTSVWTVYWYKRIYYNAWLQFYSIKFSWLIYTSKHFKITCQCFLSLRRTPLYPSSQCSANVWCGGWRNDQEGTIVDTALKTVRSNFESVLLYSVIIKIYTHGNNNIQYKGFYIQQYIDIPLAMVIRQ